MPVGGDKVDIDDTSNTREEHLPEVESVSKLIFLRDSSDDEQLSLWSAALDSPRITDPRARTLMRRRISTATSQAPAERSDVEVGVKDQDVDSELRYDRSWTLS